MARLAVTVALLAGVTACTGDPDGADATPTARPEATSTKPLARSTWQPDDPAMAALMTGELLVGDDGCVRVRDEGGRVSPVLWPTGWTASTEDPATVVVVKDPTGATRYRTGERVELGGGFVAAGRYDPQECATGAAWLATVWPDP